MAGETSYDGSPAGDPGPGWDRCGQEVVHCPERGASLLRHVFKWWPIDQDVLRNETDGQLTKKLFDLCGKLSDLVFRSLT